MGSIGTRHDSAFPRKRYGCVYCGHGKFGVALCRRQKVVFAWSAIQPYLDCNLRVSSPDTFRGLHTEIPGRTSIP
jgi:hypothetical protein